MDNDTRAGDVLAVASQGARTISFFDAATHRLLDTTEAAVAEPHELLFDPATRLIWCANTYRSGFYGHHDGGGTALTVLDADTRQVVDIVDIAPEHAPHGLALDPVRDRLYVSVEGSADRTGGVLVIDTTTRTIVERIDTGAPGPHWFEVSQDGAFGYATNKEAPFVSMVDLERGVLADRIEMPGSEGLAVSADGARVYVAAPHAAVPSTVEPGIRVIDVKSRTVVETLSTQHPCLALHRTSTGLLLAGQLQTATAIERQPSTLVVFDTDTHERRGEIEIGTLPLTIRSAPDGTLAYASCILSSTVDIIDLASMTRLARLDIPASGFGGAHGVAYVPAA